jgi:hypothetical protein
MPIKLVGHRHPRLAVIRTFVLLALLLLLWRIVDHAGTRCWIWLVLLPLVQLAQVSIQVAPGGVALRFLGSYHPVRWSEIRDTDLREELIGGSLRLRLVGGHDLFLTSLAMGPLSAVVEGFRRATSGSPPAVEVRPLPWWAR